MKNDMKKEHDDATIVQELAQVQPMSLDELIEKVKALAAQLEEEVPENKE